MIAFGASRYTIWLGAIYNLFLELALGKLDTLRLKRGDVFSMFTLC